jgi:hypothetical protein
MSAKRATPQVNLDDPALWDNISSDAQADFLRRADDMVRSTLTLAQGADLRATTMMGIFGAIGVALFAAAATLITATKPLWPLIAASGATSFVLFIACILCAAAAWPRNFYVAGFEPRNLIASSSARDDKYRIAVLIAVAQDRIDHNRRAIDRAAYFAMTAVVIAGVGIATGLAIVLYLLFREHLHPF